MGSCRRLRTGSCLQPCASSSSPAAGPSAPLALASWGHVSPSFPGAGTPVCRTGVFMGGSKHVGGMDVASRDGGGRGGGEGWQRSPQPAQGHLGCSLGLPLGTKRHRLQGLLKSARILTLELFALSSVRAGGSTQKRQSLATMSPPHSERVS